MEESFQEVLREITARPVPFAAEVVQSLLLLGVIGWAGRRSVAKRLADRRARIAAELADAERAERESAVMRDEARAVVERAEREAPGIVRAAEELAEKERETESARTAAEAEQTIQQARQAVERDKQRVVQDASERLIRLTTLTARRYLDEMLTEGERRVLTEKVILESLEEMEGGLLSRPRE